MAQAQALEQPTWPAVLRLSRQFAEVWLADRQGDIAAMYAATQRAAALADEAGHPGWTHGLNLVNGALAAGHTEEAVAHGLAVVAQLENTRHVSLLVETRIQLVGALLAGDRLAEARQHSLAAWQLVGHCSRLDFWADYQALLAALEGRFDDAALLHGYAQRMCERDAYVRAHNEAVAVERTLHLLTRQLGPEVTAQLVTQGGQLRDQDIATIAFRLPAQSAPSPPRPSRSQD